MTRRVEILTPPAVRGAAEGLALLHGTCFPDEGWTPAAIGEIAGLSGFFAVLAREDEEPVGFAFAFGTREEYEIAALGVAPARRRAGIGRALLDAVCREAGRRGGRAVFLEVAADNVAAHSLYTAHGFVGIGRRPGYYRRAGRLVDAQVLRLALAAPYSSI